MARASVPGRVVGAGVALGIAAAAGTGLLRRSGRDRSGHVSERERDYAAATHRVLVLGAGFGGLAVALELDRRLGERDDTSVLVVDRDNALLFTPLLWTVADGRAGPGDVVVPVRDFQKGRRFHLLHAQVEAIDLGRREVITSAGPRGYDTLVVALGSTTAVPDLPGLREHARVFHTAADAVGLRNALIDAVEAAHRTDDPAERRAWLTFVVGGGGDTGVELAATIREYLAAGLLAEYPWLAEDPPRVVVVGRASRLLPMADPATSDRVRRALEEGEIEVLTGASVESVDERTVRTSKGEIPARTLFWAAGITAPPVVRALPVGHAPNGALLVDDHLRLPAHPEVYAIGDAAWAYDSATGNPVPPTAQAATHQGTYVAATIAAGLDHREASAFRFAPKGHLALLGHRTGVARVGRWAFGGLPAWLLWHGYYLTRIPSWRNRLRLATGWALSGIVGRDTGQLDLGTGGKATREVAS